MQTILVFRVGQDNIDQLHGKVKEGVSKLRGLEIGDELLVEILGQLVEGRKTITELVEGVYGIHPSEEGFKSSHTRITRGIKRLESKGLASRKLLGRDRPYKLTQLAITNLARIGGEEQQQSVVPKIDVAAYLIAVVLAVPMASHAFGWLIIAETPTIVIFGCFCFLLGISFVEVVRTVRRVF